MIAVVGGGVTALVTSALIADRLGPDSVVLVNPGNEFGGLLGSSQYGRNGWFDRGTHILSETGCGPVDEVLLGALPYEEWEFHAGPRRDLAGNWRRGQLSQGSPYVDLREDEGAMGSVVLRDTLERLGSSTDAGGAISVLEARFGPAGASALGRCLAELFRCPSEDLDVLATRIAPMDRLVLVDEATYTKLIPVEGFTDRVAIPEQRRLPGGLCSPLRSFYPRRGAMQRVVDGLVAGLSRRGVRMQRGRKPVIRLSGDRVEAIDLVEEGGRETLEVDWLAWTTGAPGAARQLGIPVPDLPALRTVLVHCLLEEPPSLADLFYVYCYGTGTTAFRVTNYAAFCSGAVRDGRWPVTVELIVDRGETLDPAPAAHEALSLVAGVDAAHISFSAVEDLPTGFPVPTSTYMEVLGRLRHEIRASATNLSLLGVLAEPGLFFQTDVLRHAHEVVGALE